MTPRAVLSDGVVLPQGCEAPKVGPLDEQQDSYDSDGWSDDYGMDNEDEAPVIAVPRVNFDTLVQLIEKVSI